MKRNVLYYGDNLGIFRRYISAVYPRARMEMGVRGGHHDARIVAAPRREPAQVSHEVARVDA